MFGTGVVFYRHGANKSEVGQHGLWSWLRLLGKRIQLLAGRWFPFRNRFHAQEKGRRKVCAKFLLSFFHDYTSATFLADFIVKNYAAVPCRAASRGCDSLAVVGKGEWDVGLPTLSTCIHTSILPNTQPVVHNSVEYDDTVSDFGVYGVNIRQVSLAAHSHLPLPDARREGHY